MDIKQILNSMTLEEKASLCLGVGFWNTQSIERLNLESISVSHGPHVLREVPEEEKYESDTTISVASTCYPSGATFASSWDVDFIKKLGEALGKEALSNDV